MRIILNPATTELNRVLEGLNAQDEMSLGEMAAMGRKIRSKAGKVKRAAGARVRKAASSSYARAKSAKGKVKAVVSKAKTKKGSWLAAAWGGLGKAVQKGAAVAERFGVELPGKKELNALKEAQGKISSISYRAKVYGPGGTVHNSLLARKSPQMDALAEKLSGMARQVASQAVAVKRSVDSAIDEGERIFKGVASGSLSATGTGAFMLKQKQAMDQFKQLDLRSNALADAWKGGVEQVDKGPEVAREVARIARETVSEAGGKAAAFAKEAGEIAETTIASAGEGVKASGKMLKYLPIILIAGAGLYIITSAKATGGGLGKMFESVGTGVRRRLEK